MFNSLWFKMLKGTACEDYGRHCSEEGENNSNVFYRPSNTLPVCETDVSGNFGTGTVDVSSNDSTEDDVEHVVNFEYQVQTALNLTVARLDAADSPLYAIEKAISDTVLKGLFSGSQCTVPPVIKSRDQTRQRRLRRRSLQLYYSDQLSGLRSAPGDKVLPGAAGVTCQSDLVDTADRCYVISGAFTLLGVNDDTDFEWFEPLSVMEIKEAMDRGDFDEIEFNIVAVQFVSGNITLPERGTLEPDPIRDNDAIQESDEDGSVTWPWLVLGVGVVIFFFCIFGMNRCARRRKERIEAEYQSQAASASGSGRLPMGGSSDSVSTMSTQQTPQPTKKIKSKKQKRLDTVPETQSGDVSSVDSGGQPVMT